MQEIFPVVIKYHYPDIKMIVKGLKWLLVGIWKPIRWVLEAMFTPPPGQEYIEEARNRARQMVGHF